MGRASRPDRLPSLSLSLSLAQSPPPPPSAPRTLPSPLLSLSHTRRRRSPLLSLAHPPPAPSIRRRFPSSDRRHRRPLTPLLLTPQERYRLASSISDNAAARRRRSPPQEQRRSASPISSDDIPLEAEEAAIHNRQRQCDAAAASRSTAAYPYSCHRSSSAERFRAPFATPTPSLICLLSPDKYP
uniref:Uncharacterized protein n=1 Tax=Oryza nivara TaxID=4536 RepID=A0A0E0HL21_ORYNI